MKSPGPYQSPKVEEMQKSRSQPILLGALRQTLLAASLVTASAAAWLLNQDLQLIRTTTSYHIQSIDGIKVSNQGLATTLFVFSFLFSVPAVVSSITKPKQKSENHKTY